MNNLREKDAKLARLRRCQRAVREATDQRRRALRRRLEQRRELRGELLELTAEWRTETLQCERCGRLLQIMPQRALRGPAPLALDEPSVECANPNLGRCTGPDGRAPRRPGPRASPYGRWASTTTAACEGSTPSARRRRESQPSSLALEVRLLVEVHAVVFHHLLLLLPQAAEQPMASGWQTERVCQRSLRLVFDDDLKWRAA